jgi:UDP-N-acetylglucosamine/UDP-N-acetylgalactosamine diphosphorylase
MLNQRPIFLGGQGGIVGPCRLEFGTIVAAGSICRKDELRSGRLLLEVPRTGGNMPFVPGMYRNVKRIVVNNIVYIANLVALHHWYRHVRAQFVAEDFPAALFDALKEKLDMIIDERTARLDTFRQKMPESASTYRQHLKDQAADLVLQQKDEIYNRWQDVEALLNEIRRQKEENADRDMFLEKIRHAVKRSGKDYIRAIKSLDREDIHLGTRWLQNIVDTVTEGVLGIIPSFS